MEPMPTHMLYPVRSSPSLLLAPMLDILAVIELSPKFLAWRTAAAPTRPLSPHLLPPSTGAGQIVSMVHEFTAIDQRTQLLLPINSSALTTSKLRLRQSLLQCLITSWMRFWQRNLPSLQQFLQFSL